jgi:hypothetical protein
MRTYLKIISIIGIMTAGLAHAQSIGPDSLIQEPMTPPPVQPQAPDQSQLQFKMLQRQMGCQSIPNVRLFLEARGIITWASGFNQSQPDVFDGVIISRNPETLEYAVLLVNLQNSVACIIAIGDEIKLLEEME